MADFSGERVSGRVEVAGGAVDHGVAFKTGDLGDHVDEAAVVAEPGTVGGKTEDLVVAFTADVLEVGVGIGEGHARCGCWRGLQPSCRHRTGTA